MYMNRFMTGAVIGGTLGAIGAAYVLATNHQKREWGRKGRQLINQTNEMMKERF